MLLCLLYRYEYLYIYIYKSTRFIGLSKFKCFLCLSQDQEVYRIAGTTSDPPNRRLWKHNNDNRYDLEPHLL